MPSLLWLVVLAAAGSVLGSDGDFPDTYRYGLVSFEFVGSGGQMQRLKTKGTYGDKSSHLEVQGELHHVNSSLEDPALLQHGCDNVFYGVPADTQWIALIRRGGCQFNRKIANALKHGAEAVIVYNKNETKLKSDEVYVMMHADFGVPVIMIQHDMGLFIGSRTQPVHVRITPDDESLPGATTLDPTAAGEPRDSTSVLVVAIVFIALMLIALGWLVMYYVQRYRQSSAKDRHTRETMDAVKKAMKKFALRKLSVEEMKADCMICHETYSPAFNVVRVLPCRHMFHKRCIEKWLLTPDNSLTCPLCNMNLLEAVGVALPSRSRRTTETPSAQPMGFVGSSASRLGDEELGAVGGVNLSMGDTSALGAVGGASNADMTLGLAPGVSDEDDDSQDSVGQVDERQSLVGGSQHHRSSSGPGAIFSSRHRNTSGSAKVFMSTGSQLHQ